MSAFSFIDSTISFIGTLHPYLQAGLIVLASWFVGLVLLPIVDSIVSRLTQGTDTDIDDKLAESLHPTLLYFVILSGTSYAVQLLGFSEGVMNIVTSLLQSSFIIVLVRGIIRAVHIILEGASDSERVHAINRQTLPLFVNTALIIGWAMAIYALFLVWGIDVTAWLASAGIIGIAVGFAAKDTLSNIISGIFILADKPYSIGDFVLLGSGITGIVTDVGLRSTRIRTFDDEEVTIPNATIANDAITNKTTGPDTGRVKVSIGVAYGSDLEKVKTILLEVAKAHEKVLDEPEPSVSFLGFGDSSLDFALFCRVANSLDVFGTRSDLHYEVNRRFAEENIEIPFPQRDVHLKKD